MHATLQTLRCPANKLELQITEAALMQNGEATIATLHQLRGLGTRISLDNFGTVAWVAIFSLLAVSARGFESSRIERWSRVRTVIDRPGLSLSTDANQLCTTRRSSGGLLLPTGTMVEGLERRVCFNRRLLDEDVPRPADSWSVERVRVLTGSNGGAEGWVLAYGLLEELQH